jgi:hypothetical protein
MSKRSPKKTIDQVLEEFLAEQKARLSPKTFRKYEDIIDLFRSCLDSYWPGSNQREYDRVTSAGGTFCGTFGPDELPGGVDEFLGYFVPNKVVAGKETAKAAARVTKKLMKWLVEKEYLADPEAAEAAETRAGRAARDLPAAQEVVDMLEAFIDVHAPDSYSQALEDHFTIMRIEPGKLWLQPLISGGATIGPVPVPPEVSRTCRQGWDLGGIAVRTSRGWRLIEVWKVSP